MWVKICGITTEEGAQAAVSFGADAIGFVFAPSRRRVDPDRAREIAGLIPGKIDRIGVFMNETASRVAEIAQRAGLTGVQLHGDESPEYCRRLKALLERRPGNPRIIKGFRLRGPDDVGAIAGYPSDAVLVDAFVEEAAGGTGQTCDWDLARRAVTRSKSPVILAGGLTPENAARAIEVVGPAGVDVSSGVETGGRKDPAKIQRFVQEVRRCKL